MSDNQNLEIERKFLIDKELFTNKIKKNCSPFKLTQGYLVNDKDKVIRIRHTDLSGWITIKGEGLLSRKEYEYQIPSKDAIELLNSFCKDVIVKTRYRFVSPTDMRHTWEVDFFEGDNDGLVLAEIELKSENEKFEKPKWVLDEVTGEHKYYNSNLIKNPYKNWL